MRFRCDFLAAIFIGVTPTIISAQGLRPDSYNLSATFHPQQNAMAAVAEISFEHMQAPLQEVTFYLHGELSVDSLTVDGLSMPFSQDKEFYSYNYSLIATKVSVDYEGANAPEMMTVHYSGFFNPSRARSRSDYMRITGEGVFLRAYGYSLWFPVFLQAEEEAYTAAFEVTIKTPETLTPVFAGNFVDKNTQDGHTISKWSAKDIDIFDAQCTAAPFVVLREGNYFIYSFQDPRSFAKAGNILAFTKDLHALFSSHYGKVGNGSQLHIMQMPKYGNISSYNVVGISSDLWHEFDEQSFSGRTLAHEMVHPFVQVNVPKQDSLYAFVIEGFASYFYLPILAEHISEEYYQNFIQRVYDGYLDKRRTGKNSRGWSLPPEKPLLAISAEEIGVYKDMFVLNDRALLFFDYIRHKLGKTKFFEFSKELFSLSEIDTALFTNLFLKYMPASERDLQIWLRTTEFPDTRF